MRLSFRMQNNAKIINQQRPDGNTTARSARNMSSGLNTSGVKSKSGAKVEDPSEQLSN
jgi:hypothetical protein